MPRKIELDSIYKKSKQDNNKFKIDENCPQAVKDFIALSEMNLKLINELSEQEKHLSNYLQGCDAKITGDFLTYWKQKVDGEENIKLHVRHIRDSDGNGHLAFFVKDNDIDFYPEQRSKGFLWFLSFYLRLAASQKIEPEREFVLLIDEPGSYLHAKAQKDVLHLFEDRISKSQHIIYSTHSPFLLPSKDLHRLRVVVNDKNHGTIAIDRLTHPILQGNKFTDTLTPIISSIGIDVRETIKYIKERSILVEGLSDYIYLCAWSKELNHELVNEATIFPGTGAPTLPTFASLFIGWGLKFIILMDRDRQAERQKKILMTKLGIGNERIIQPTDSITIEDIFSKEDFRKILSSIDDKSVVSG